MTDQPAPLTDAQKQWIEQALEAAGVVPTPEAVAQVAQQAGPPPVADPTPGSDSTPSTEPAAVDPTPAADAPAGAAPADSGAASTAPATEPNPTEAPASSAGAAVSGTPAGSSATPTELAPLTLHDCPVCGNADINTSVQGSGIVLSCLNCGSTLDIQPYAPSQ